MFLRRVQVPNFRVLKDVDITFEPEFSPRIFPLGSLNGGGKSTLLQLIFILLRCSSDPEKHFFIQNILDGFTVNTESEQKLLSLEITNEDDSVNIDFIVYSDSSISNLICTVNENSISEEEKKHLKFSIFEDLKSVENKILDLKSEIKVLSRSSSQLKKTREIEDQDIRGSRVFDVIENLRENNSKLELLSNRKTFNQRFMSRRHFQEILSIDEILEEIRQTNDINEINLNQAYLERDILDSSISKILKYIESKNLRYICNFRNSLNNESALLLHVHNSDVNKSQCFMQEISTKIFLAAPSTQIFLFTDKSLRQLLFKESDHSRVYDFNIQSYKDKLKSFFTYDFLPIDILIESFKLARDKDFKERVDYGEYGNHYGNLLNELNSLLGNKKININTDLSGINFHININGETRELYPEDLSHGELKRLGIYMWLKQRQIENSIVLIDEIENALHPDWQYQIISDLTEWGKSNQYILATHSYELCQALTPAHVKELEPKLLPSKQVEN